MDRKYSTPVDLGPLEKSKVCGLWYITMGGNTYIPAQIGEMFGLRSDTVCQKLAIKTAEEFTEWLSLKAELKSLGLPTTTRLFRRGKEVAWSRLVVNEIKCHVSHALRVLREWEDGERDWDSMFVPFTGSSSTGLPDSEPPDWQGLTDDDRQGPEWAPGSWERDLPQPEDGCGYGFNGHQAIMNSDGTTYYQGD